MNTVLKSFFLVITTVFALVSCRDTFSSEGDLLNGINYSANTFGDHRFLYQEVTSADTLAEYKYSGQQLIQIKGIKNMTNMSYSGDLVNKITHSNTASADSIYLNQELLYNTAGTGKLDKIIEHKSIFSPSATPGPLVEKKYYSEYDITYNSNGKVATILMKEGQVLPNTQWKASTYKKITLTYNIENTNVITNKIEVGTVSDNVLSTPVVEHNYTYLEYDGMKSPYRLLPYEYLIFRLSQGSGNEGYIFSQETPKHLQFQGNNVPVPQDILNRNLKYDKDKYLILGWKRVFEYRPF